MFYPECERLANEKPSLREVIIRLDSILNSTGKSSVFRPSRISEILNERSSQISGILNRLVDYGLLYKENYIECPNCGNLIKPRYYEEALIENDSFECTQCQVNLFESTPSEVIAYRIKPREGLSVTKESISYSLPELSQRSYQELPSYISTDPFKNTPLLRYYSNDRDLIEKRPFKGKRVLILLHFLRDLIPFINAAMKLGLNMEDSIFFYKDYPYPQRDSVKRWLEEHDAKVVPRSLIDKIIEKLSEDTTNRAKNIIIIEDGGFVGPLILQQFPKLSENVIGSVEQTTRGIRNIEKAGISGLKFPIISVATSKLKSEFEPPYIAKAAVANISRLLPNFALPGKKVALFGCGTIGREIANWLDINHANLVIYDTTPENRLWVQQHGFSLAESAAQAAENKNLVIGASGNTSITSDVIKNLPHGSYLASASSELYEIDIDELVRQNIKMNLLNNDDDIEIGTTFTLPPTNRQINLLANGYPVNFWGFESMPEQASDLILSLILLSSVEISIGNYSEPIINPQAVNSIADKYDIAGKFLEFHSLG